MGIKTDVKDIDKLIRNIKTLKSSLPGGGGALSQSIKKLLDRVGQNILSAVKAETPVGDDSRPDFHATSKFHKGRDHLKDAWKWKIETKGTVVSGFAFVTPNKLDSLIDLLQAGSPPHVIKPMRGKVLRFFVRSGGGWDEIYKKSVNHPGFKANKFVEKAKSKTDGDIKSIVPAVQAEINKLVRIR